MTVALVDDIRAHLRLAADPTRAPAQQAYMKSAMPYLGVTVPEVRRCARRTAAAHDLDADTVRAAARELWDDAEYREERYAAEALLALPAVRGDLRSLPHIEHMVRTGLWWDFTDELSGRVRDLLDAHPATVTPLVDAWSSGTDLWMRRLSIVSQLGRRDRLDRRLLEAVISRNVGDPEFFIRKAIGWALRDAARHDPDWVRAVAASYELSPLSRREALKHL